jgi:hypothetical protein
LSQANLQLETLTEKVQLLTAELNQQEQDANELVRELQQQLVAAQGKLQEYQAAEGMLDKAVLGAAAAGGRAGLLLCIHVYMRYACAVRADGAGTAKGLLAARGGTCMESGKQQVMPKAAPLGPQLEQLESADCIRLL